tara:strand:- start:192 stop:548 length:357 start_codon:yes stop_codon:yes gene_type:complete
MKKNKKTPEGSEQTFLSYVKGDVPLKISFWGIYVFAWNVVCTNIIGWILPRMGFELNIIQLISAPIIILLAIGVWNSAGKYKGKKIWSVLAKVIVATQCFAAVIILITLILGIDLNNL